MTSFFAICLAAAQAGSLGDLAAPPPLPNRPEPAIRCACPQDAPEEKIVFTGIVVDAELRVDASGRAVQPRQATVFRLIRADDPALKTPVKVWHPIESERCGLSFDYGRQYTLAARRTEKGALETDQCLLRAAPADE
ncbi:hypothetical protein [Amphiplicatus metriothermophilus]|uniref:Tissue inhibitor of metalloproteinase n=1 Tax=Amphiplicatus metriothermophilus TaxID=1519374 RepID=A0A239PKS9_9PROT|nr:hypothetical protein [Amphiplicatus metriothermophilus]MBB5517480.1 hypothetical protein [Amphiplicatus metriothermophilus]SNT68185.1 hypothetical protein SAMN06297382_0682 [Amphiplicatus metriothermophilus]